MLYGTIVGYPVLHPLVYLLFPTSAVFAIVMQTAFYAQISLWETKSVELIQLLRRNAEIVSSTQLENKRMRVDVNRLVPLRCKISFFGSFSVDSSNECMNQTFSMLLLLLSM